MKKPMLSRRTYAVLRGYEKLLGDLHTAQVERQWDSQKHAKISADIKIARGSLISHLLHMERQILVRPCTAHPQAGMCTGRDLQWRCPTCGDVLTVETVAS